MDLRKDSHRFFKIHLTRNNHKPLSISENPSIKLDNNIAINQPRTVSVCIYTPHRILKDQQYNQTRQFLNIQLREFESHCIYPANRRPARSQTIQTVFSEECGCVWGSVSLLMRPLQKLIQVLVMPVSLGPHC